MYFLYIVDVRIISYSSRYCNWKEENLSPKSPVMW